MTLDAPTPIQQDAFAQSFGCAQMAIHTPYQKSSSDDRMYDTWNEGSANGYLQQNPTDLLMEISLLDSFRLLFQYVKALNSVGSNDQALALPIFSKTIKFLLSRGVDKEKISITHTTDDSVLVKGVAADKTFYFETYFDNLEYSSGYEVTGNIYANKKIIASSAGSIDFVLQNS